MRKRRFHLGYIPDKFDRNDYLMRGFLRPTVKIPEKIDYTEAITPVRDQGNEGVCVGFASVCGMKEYQEQKDYGKPVELSPRFVYSECKKVDGSPNSEGTSIRVAMKVLSETGVCRELLWPYSPHQTDNPRLGYLVDASKFKIQSYARILNLHELKLTLATHGPNVTIGVMVYQGMMTTKNGVVPLPKRRDRALGGHAIYPVGYNDKTQFVKFKNSWGEGWGNNGFGYLPYRYITRYMIDAWSSVDIDDPNPLTIGDVMDVVETANERVK